MIFYFCIFANISSSFSNESFDDIATLETMLNCFLLLFLHAAAIFVRPTLSYAIPQSSAKNNTHDKNAAEK